MSRLLALRLTLRVPSLDPMTSDELEAHLKKSLASGLFASDFDLSIEGDSYDPPGVKQLDMFGEVKP